MLSSNDNSDLAQLAGDGSRGELEYPDRLVEPSGWLGHIPFAMWLIGALRPSMLVELGVHTGNSYCAFLQAIDRLRFDTRCFGVDHWRGDQHAGHYGDEIYHELRAYHDARYARFSTLLRSSFDEAQSYFSDGTIDLLHIDGFHSYEAAAADFTTWLPKMSSRGVVLFHDTNVRERGFGIWKFWSELELRYPHFEFPHSHGLGIAYVGRDPLAGPLEMLFAMKCATEIERVRNYFARLGSSVTDRRSVVTLNGNLDDARSELTRYRADTEVLLTAQRKAGEELQAADEKTKELEAVTAQLKDELHGNQQQLNQVLQSRSWRYTAPIRQVVAQLRQLAFSKGQSFGNSKTNVPP
jgi:Methyltransferase domain